MIKKYSLIIFYIFLALQCFTMEITDELEMTDLELKNSHRSLACLSPRSLKIFVSALNNYCLNKKINSYPFTDVNGQHLAADSLPVKYIEMLQQNHEDVDISSLFNDKLNNNDKSLLFFHNNLYNKQVDFLLVKQKLEQASLRGELADIIRLYITLQPIKQKDFADRVLEEHAILVLDDPELEYEDYKIIIDVFLDYAPKGQLKNGLYKLPLDKSIIDRVLDALERHMTKFQYCYKFIYEESKKLYKLFAHVYAKDRFFIMLDKFMHTKSESMGLFNFETLEKYYRDKGDINKANFYNQKIIFEREQEERREDERRREAKERMENKRASLR